MTYLLLGALLFLIPVIFIAAYIRHRRLPGEAFPASPPVPRTKLPADSDPYPKAHAFYGTRDRERVLAPYPPPVRTTRVLTIPEDRKHRRDDDDITAYTPVILSAGEYKPPTIETPDTPDFKPADGAFGGAGATESF